MSDFTFMFWVKGSYNNWHWIWSAGDQSNHFSFGSSANHWEFVWNFEEPMATGSGIRSDSWQHLAFVCSSSIVMVFIDGRIVGAADVGSALDFTEFRITKAPGHTELFAAHIDDIGLWDEALNAAEITDYMTNGIPAEPVGCPCQGDLAEPLGQVDLQDLDALVNLLVNAGPPFIVPVGPGHCGDMTDPMKQVDLQDLDALVNLLVNAGPPFILPCE